MFTVIEQKLDNDWTRTEKIIKLNKRLQVRLFPKHISKGEDLLCFQFISRDHHWVHKPTIDTLDLLMKYEAKILEEWKELASRKGYILYPTKSPNSLQHECMRKIKTYANCVQSLPLPEKLKQTIDTESFPLEPGKWEDIIIGSKLLGFRKVLTPNLIVIVKNMEPYGGPVLLFKNYIPHVYREVIHCNHLTFLEFQKTIKSIPELKRCFLKIDTMKDITFTHYFFRMGQGNVFL